MPWKFLKMFARNSSYLFRYQVNLPIGHFEVNVNRTTNWVHAVMNYVGPNEGQGIRIYNDGELVGSDTTKTNEANLPSDGRIIIGRADLNIVGTAGFLTFYASVEVDEFLVFNRTLTEPEIILLNQRVI